jgi:hypothetical protein
MFWWVSWDMMFLGMDRSVARPKIGRPNCDLKALALACNHVVILSLTSTSCQSIPIERVGQRAGFIDIHLKRSNPTFCNSFVQKISAS